MDEIPYEVIAQQDGPEQHEEAMSNLRPALQYSLDHNAVRGSYSISD